MKKIFCILLAAGATVPAHAQLFSPTSFGSTVLGGLIGGIIGHNQHGQTAEGAAIGAGAGLLLGALADAYRPPPYEYTTYAPPPATYAPPPYRYGTIPYAGTGAVLGGIAGGIIGHNSNGHTAEGVAIGAASGLVLGAVADHAVRTQTVPPPPVVTEVVQTAPAAAAPVQNAVQSQNPVVVSTMSSSPARPMSSANALFGR